MRRQQRIRQRLRRFPASSSGDTHKLSVVLKTTSSEYWSYVIAGIEQAEKDLGNVEVDVRGANSDTDFDGQLNMVETIVNADMCEAIAIARCRQTRSQMH